MSLDVYLHAPEPHPTAGSGIFIRENGSMREVSREEWDSRFPGCEPVVAQRESESTEVFSANITHNLGRMANAAGIYKACWRPEECCITRAKYLIPVLRDGLDRLKSDPDYYRKFDASNGWGTYEQFVPWVEEYLRACEQNPEATVSVSR